jgi:hypothetical protein
MEGIILSEAAVQAKRKPALSEAEGNFARGRLQSVFSATSAVPSRSQRSRASLCGVQGAHSGRSPVIAP